MMVEFPFVRVLLMRIYANGGEAGDYMRFFVFLPVKCLCPWDTHSALHAERRDYLVREYPDLVIIEILCVPHKFCPSCCFPFSWFWPFRVFYFEYQRHQVLNSNFFDCISCLIC